MAQSEVFSFHADALGAPANIIIAAQSRLLAQMAFAAAAAEIDRLDRLLSVYRQDSEISRLNRSEWMAVSPELFAVIRHGEIMGVRSGGAFSGRLGAVERLWRNAGTTPPAREELLRAARAAGQSVRMDAIDRTVYRPTGVEFALDALAKGFVIDHALLAARSAAPLDGIVVDIGGDLSCRGFSKATDHWDVGLPDPNLPFANAPLVSSVRLRNQAIATSGRGPRDRFIDQETFSVTLNPDTGWPVKGNLAATVVAPTAAEADGLATALLVMGPEEGLDLAERSEGVEARITLASGEVQNTRNWNRLALEPALIRAADTKPRHSVAKGATHTRRTPNDVADPAVGPSGWVIDWALQVSYSAPQGAGRRLDFRSPYLAMWITDKQNRPVRTLVLVGQDPQWQKDNVVWWGMYGERAPRQVELRSTATALAGRYPMYWPGWDDNSKTMPAGDYILHIESSAEHGAHTYRAIPLTLGRVPFDIEVPPTADNGQLTLHYGRRD
jgi:thiamine biosynthesis lipoprotein